MVIPRSRKSGIVAMLFYLRIIKQYLIFISEKENVMTILKHLEINIGFIDKRWLHYRVKFKKKVDTLMKINSVNKRKNIYLSKDSNYLHIIYEIGCCDIDINQ